MFLILQNSWKLRCANPSLIFKKSLLGKLESLYTATGVSYSHCVGKVLLDRRTGYHLVGYKEHPTKLIASCARISLQHNSIFFELKLYCPVCHLWAWLHYSPFSPIYWLSTWKDAKAFCELGTSLEPKNVLVGSTTVPWARKMQLLMMGLLS